MIKKLSPIIKGKLVDEYTRCEHYHSLNDVIAIKFKCCNEYYPCYYCHDEKTDHRPEVWKRSEFETKAVLCGICKNEMTIHEYLTSNDHCPYCHTAFNPNCKNHYHLYFEI